MASDECDSPCKSAFPQGDSRAFDEELQLEKAVADSDLRNDHGFWMQRTEHRCRQVCAGALWRSDNSVRSPLRCQAPVEQAQVGGEEPRMLIGKLQPHSVAAPSTLEQRGTFEEPRDGAASPAQEDPLRSEPLTALEAIMVPGKGHGPHEQSSRCYMLHGPCCVRRRLRLSGQTEKKKKIYLIGFRGTTFEDPEYKEEPALIKAGHLGFAFEDNPDLIFGFHPTPEAIAMAGGEEAAIERLSQCKPLDGALQSDRTYFVRAHELCRAGARTDVWQVAIELPYAEYLKVRTQALHWLFKHTVFPYCFPRRGTCFSLPLDRDNCATFPRRLALPIPDPSGQLARCMSVMQARGERWTPEVPWAHGRWKEV